MDAPHSFCIRTAVNFGREDLNKHLLKLLTDRGHYFNLAEMEKVRDIKEIVLHCTQL
jgi:hypothetical protein